MSLPPDKIAALEAAAVAMIGLPETRCQLAMANMYKAAGLLPADLAVPDGTRDWARTQGCSLITPFVESCGYFKSIDAIEPGALLGFRLGHTLHHVAIALPGGRLAHIFGMHGVQIAPCIPTEWVKRLERIWQVCPEGNS